MSLFKAAKVADYSVRVSSMLQKYELYDREKFHNMYFGVTRQSFKESPESRLAFKKESQESRLAFSMYYGNLYSLTYNGMENICSDAVRRTYIDYAIREAFSKQQTYDILFAMDKGVMSEPESTENAMDKGVMSEPESTENTLNEKMRREKEMEKMRREKEKMRRAVVGVIIVQKGECERRPNSWCIKVICVRPNTVKGSVLMGACLYCIKDYSYIKECLLELADGYSNLPAFYSYTALGFLRDDSLWGEGCFKENDCMPMCANLNTVSIDDIIKKVLGTAPLLMLSMKEDPSGLWNRKCEVAKYTKNDTSPGYVVLKEIQTISNVMLGLTLLKNAYIPDSSAEVRLLERYRRSWFNMKPNIVIRRQLSVKLNAKLGEFDRLAGALPGAGCTISVGGGRKKSRGKGTRGKRARGTKTRRRKYNNPK